MALTLNKASATRKAHRRLCVCVCVFSAFARPLQISRKHGFKDRLVIIIIIIIIEILILVLILI